MAEQTSIWYRVELGKITQVEVAKWTEKTVTLASSMWGRSRRRMTQYESYHPTRDAAKAYLVEQRRTELEQARRKLDRARGLLKNAEAL